ncbi:hypothetical protein [Pseudoxanthomonas sp. UTMC 1351]|uniref:hypothetical protein n=1 Tax=Pseudoxanthomonas sp. UTMC 1351 TaxID=2695853 RepID=UPI0034CFAB09
MSQRAVTMRCVEIRSYRLKPGTRDTFDRLMSDISVPMLRHWQTDVVCHGASAHDEVFYYLVRAYSSVEDRQRRQDEFYGGTEWRDGPRQAILDLIEDRACYPLGSTPYIGRHSHGRPHHRQAQEQGK